MNRGAAAAATWIFLRRIAAPPRPRRGHSVETGARRRYNVVRDARAMAVFALCYNAAYGGRRRNLPLRQDEVRGRVAAPPRLATWIFRGGGSFVLRYLACSGHRFARRLVRRDDHENWRRCYVRHGLFGAVSLTRWASDGFLLSVAVFAAASVRRRAARRRAARSRRGEADLETRETELTAPGDATAPSQSPLHDGAGAPRRRAEDDTPEDDVFAPRGISFDESRRRRGCHVDMPRRRVAARRIFRWSPRRVSQVLPEEEPARPRETTGDAPGEEEEEEPARPRGPSRGASGLAGLEEPTRRAAPRFALAAVVAMLATLPWSFGCKHMGATERTTALFVPYRVSASKSRRDEARSG